jgi:hypothetical protein
MESKNKARHKYNFSFKLKVIKFAEEKRKHAAAKFFNIDRKCVCLLLISEIMTKKEKGNITCTSNKVNYCI